MDRDHAQQQQAPAMEIPEHMRLQDLEGWLQLNGLRAAGDAADPPTLDEEEAIERFQQSSAYQSAMHQAIFANHVEAEKQAKEARKKRIREWGQHTTIRLTTSGDTLVEALEPLAESCDTIYALASSWNDFSSSGKELSLSLEPYAESSVQSFCRLVDGSGSATALSSDAIVECCQIAHYLQNERVLGETVEILTRSITTENCLSMSQLADQLNLPNLFERALSHMMDTLGDVKEGLGEDWENLLTPELKERITAIQTAIQSSINAQRSRLYFSSLDEYIAIFAERVQYYRERLDEAKAQQEAERPYTRAWWYAHEKINRQEIRVRTLETALREQKKLFASKRLRSE